MTTVVIDTNVLVVANLRTRQAGPACVQACVAALMQAKKDGRIALDTGMRIINEYIHQQMSFAGQPGVGDAFFKWAFDNQGNAAHCELVEIHPVGDDPDDFREFPSDPALAGFDRSDRKFVAVARASVSSPGILNAVDSDWWIHRAALESHGVEVVFLCSGQFQGQE